MPTSWKKPLLFVFANLVAIVVTIAIYAVGFTYDQSHQIYPEAVRVSYDVTLEGIHGQRWYRLLIGTLCAIGAIDAVMIMIFLIRRRS